MGVSAHADTETHKISTCQKKEKKKKRKRKKEKERNNSFNDENLSRIVNA